MRASVVKLIPATERHEAYGFAKALGVNNHDIIVHASEVVRGELYVGAIIDCDVRKTNSGRLKGIGIRVQAGA